MPFHILRSHSQVTFEVTGHRPQYHGLRDVEMMDDIDTRRWSSHALFAAHGLCGCCFAE